MAVGAEHRPSPAQWHHIRMKFSRAERKSLNTQSINQSIHQSNKHRSPCFIY